MEHYGGAGRSVWRHDRSDTAICHRSLIQLGASIQCHRMRGHGGIDVFFASQHHSRCFIWKNGGVTGYCPVGCSDFDVTNIRLTSMAGALPMSVPMAAFLGTGSSLRMRGVQIHDLFTSNANNCFLIQNSTGEQYYDVMNIQHGNCFDFSLQGQGVNVVSNSILAFNSSGNQLLTCSSANCTLLDDYMGAGGSGPVNMAGTNSVLNVIGGFYLNQTFNASGSSHTLRFSGGMQDAASANQPNIVDTTNMVVYVNGALLSHSFAGKSIFTGTGQVWDLGGNTATTNAGTVINGPALFQTNSITGTALTTGNVGLTSGWGASSVATATGDSHQGRFTITGAAGSASPTLTLTFPTPYWTGSFPASCKIFFTGTNTGLTSAT